MPWCHTLRIQCATVLLCLAWAPRTAKGVDVLGYIEDPNTTYGGGVNYNVVSNTVFGWKTGTISGNVNLNTNNFTMDTGGGNVARFSGSISGAGNFTWNGGGNGVGWQTTASYLSGASANTLSGTFTVSLGTLALAKTAGVDAIAGPLAIGGGANQAILRLDASNQIKDTSSITMTGSQPARIWTQGYSDSVGTLRIQTKSEIDLGAGSSVLRFADSSGVAWSSGNQLLIKNWSGSLTGGGSEQVSFGSSAAGLTTNQLAQLGFVSPAGKVAGLYRAQMLSSGEVVPASTAVLPVNPPFDVSTTAQAARQAIHSSNGRANLSGSGTPLTNGTKISFFGDSITWQNGYIGKIQTALNTGAGTSGRSITCINRGINGGGVLAVRDGSTDSAYPGSIAQAPFASVIASDQASVAVVFIGINDVWWRTTSTNTFDQALHDIAASASSAGVRLVLATLTVHNEMPDGSNSDDPAIEVFAQITRQVAADTGASLVDLRRVYIAYEQNNNWELNLDGSLSFQSSGILTYDGVHPTDTGNNLLADHISQGIYNAFVTQPATPSGLAASATNLLVSLKWNAVTSATGYNVKRSLASDSGFALLGSTSTATNYVDSQVTNGVLYWYVVSATNSAGASTNTAAVSARPLPATAPTPVFLTGSGTNSALSMNTTAGATLRFAGMGGINYCISYRDDLRSGSWTNLAWQPCTNNGTAPMALMDSGATNRPQRFYRIGAQKP